MPIEDWSSRQGNFGRHRHFPSDLIDENGESMDSGLRVKTVTLTDEEWKALPTQTVTLIEAPGEGRALFVPMFAGSAAAVASFYLNYVDEYTNVADACRWIFEMGAHPGGRWDAYYEMGISGSLRFLKNWGAPVGGNLPDPDGSNPPFNDGWENKPLTTRMDNDGDGNWEGGGDGAFMRLVIPYFVVSLEP